MTAPRSAGAVSRSEFSLGDLGSLVALAAIWGFTFLFIEVAIRGLTPLWLVSGRTLTGFVVLLAAMSARRLPLPRRRGDLAHLAFLAIPGNVVPWTLVAWAQQSITSGLTAVLYALLPLATLLLAVAMGTERMTARKLVGLLVAVAGSFLVVRGDVVAPDHPVAVVAVLAAVVLLALGAVYAKRFVTDRIHPLPMATVQVGVAFLAVTVVALLVDGSPDWRAMSFPVLASVVTLGAAGTGLAFLLYYALIGRVGATNATLVTYLIPVIGLLAGWAILDEHLTLPILAGCAVIVVGVWLAQRSRTREEAA